MDAKEYLLEYARQRDRLLDMKRRLADLREETGLKSSQIFPEGRSRGHPGIPDPTGRRAAMIADAEDKVNGQTLRVLDALEAVHDLIDALPEPDHSHVLFERYIMLRPWDEIAKDMGRNPSAVRGRLLKAALQSAQKILDLDEEGKKRK